MSPTDRVKLGAFVYTFGDYPAGRLHPASAATGANDLRATA